MPIAGGFAKGPCAAAHHRSRANDRHFPIDGHSDTRLGILPSRELNRDAPLNPNRPRNAEDAFRAVRRFWGPPKECEGGR